MFIESMAIFKTKFAYCFLNSQLQSKTGHILCSYIKSSSLKSLGVNRWRSKPKNLSSFNQLVTTLAYKSIMRVHPHNYYYERLLNGI